MSFADRRETIGASANWVRTWPRRYGLALIAVAVATLLRYALSKLLGPNLPFLLFYPAILLVAWLAGVGPGVFAVLLSAVSASYLFFGPANPSALGLPVNVNGLILFSIAGVAISLLADRYRRRAQRLQEFERAVAGVEEGIIIVDRQYRYAVANHAFLDYRGMKGEQLIGHSLAEFMGAGVFETSVKPKLDECFQGKVVKFEKRYSYPRLGERDFSVSYFPIEGPTGVDRVACILQDITEQKEAERSLKLFRTLVDQTNDALEVVDPETLRFLDVNEKACKDLGYSQEELLAMTVFDINPGVDETNRAKVMERLRKTGFVVQEGVHRRKDGSTFPVETSLRYVQLDRTYVVAVSRDITDRKRVDDALHEREEKFHQVADNIQEIFWMVDAASKQAIYVNPAFERITGRTVASLVDAPLSYREIIHADDRLRVLNQLSEAMTTGKLDEEFRIVRPDGTIRWVEAHGFPVRNSEGNIYRLAGVVADITARRLAEGALQESEDRYRDLVEHSEDLVCTHDLEGRLLSVNPAPARVLGYEASELLKIPMRELIAPEYRGLFDEYLARIKVNGSDKGLMVVLPRTGGRRTWEYNNTLRTEGVASPIVRGMAHDVTERRRAEIGWQESEERFRVALKGSPITVFNQDRELRYTWIYNPQLYWQHEAIGKTDIEIIGAKKAAGLVELKRRALETGVGVREDVTIHHEGRNYAFDITIEPLFGADGKVIGITGTSMDIARFREMS
jgi:PAS domain S-box-containing protein